MNDSILTTRRTFLKGVALLTFNLLPGAGRNWKGVKPFVVICSDSWLIQENGIWVYTQVQDSFNVPSQVIYCADLASGALIRNAGVTARIHRLLTEEESYYKCDYHNHRRNKFWAKIL